jgi:ATP/maltotriose-dependent transcriptional regulator MalT
MRLACWASAFTGRIHYETGNLDVAIDLARDTLLMAPGLFTAAKNASAHTLVRAYLAQGRFAEARAAIAADRRRLDLAGAPGLLPHDDALEALVDLATGDLARAARWADATPVGIAPGQLLTDDRIPVIQSRIWLARNRPGDADRALAALTAVRDHEIAVHHRYFLGRVLPHLAVAHALAGDPAAASRIMTEALEADAGLAVRRFADAGPVALDLLAAIAADPGHPCAMRAASILSRLAPAADPAPAAPVPAAPSPFTARETEVLARMAEWKTNKEIAEEMRISPVTVRDHGVQIYRKLGVGDRRTAVDVARAAGWLRDR